MPDFDVIIVGAGVAGSVAGYVLAKAGNDVLIVERGNFAGSKNMTGGRLYSHSLEKVIPGFYQEAPVERKITKERISIMTPESSFSIDFQSSTLLGRRTKDSYTVLRSSFDRWLAEKAEEAGANIVTGIRVDNLLVKNNKVAGIIAGDEIMEARAVILADGANALLAQKAGLRKELVPSQVSVGVKEIIQLDERAVEERFNLNSGEGLSWMFMGSCTEGKIGGGFLYTNKDTISIGLVLNISEITGSQKSLPELMEEFKQHPSIKPLIEGGTLLEYSAHIVPEGGWDMLPRIYDDNVLIVGDAAGLVINIGYMVRGMDLAVESAVLAAETLILAKEKDDFSAATLSNYQKKLEESFIGQDMKLYRRFPRFMESTPRLFKEYPELLMSLLASLFVVDGQPQKPLRKKVMQELSKVGYVNLMKDLWKGAKVI